MKRILVQTLTVIGVASTALVFTPACADNDQSLFIHGVLAPSTNRQNNSCIYTSDPTQALLFEGQFDVGAVDSYSVTVLVGSQLIQRSDTTNARSESNRAHINGAIVKVTDPNGAVLGEFTSLGSGFVDVSQQNQAQFGPTAFTVIDQPTQAKIGPLLPDQSKLVVANIKVFGKTLGGVDLESGEFQFPIRVCNGCLISFTSGDDPATPGLDCNLPLTAASGGGAAQLPCAIGEDETTPCQLCLNHEYPAGSKKFPCRTRE